MWSCALSGSDFKIKGCLIFFSDSPVQHSNQFNYQPVIQGVFLISFFNVTDLLTTSYTFWTMRHYAVESLRHCPVAPLCHCTLAPQWNLFVCMSDYQPVSYSVHPVLIRSHTANLHVRKVLFFWLPLSVCCKDSGGSYSSEWREWFFLVLSKNKSANLSPFLSFLNIWQTSWYWIKFCVRFFW